MLIPPCMRWVFTRRNFKHLFVSHHALQQIPWPPWDYYIPVDLISFHRSNLPVLPQCVTEMCSCCASVKFWTARRLCQWHKIKLEVFLSCFFLSFFVGFFFFLLEMDFKVQAHISVHGCIFWERRPALWNGDTASGRMMDRSVRSVTLARSQNRTGDLLRVILAHVSNGFFFFFLSVCCTCSAIHNSSPAFPRLIPLPVSFCYLLNLFFLGGSPSAKL